MLRFYIRPLLTCATTVALFLWGSICVAQTEDSAWFQRMNLDGHPRVLALRLSDDMWAAYLTEYGALYKVWRDGISFDGILYDKAPGTNPQSLGPAYFVSHQNYPWRISVDGRVVQPAFRYIGHRLDAGQIVLLYELSVGEVTIGIEESVSRVTNQEGAIGFQRRFITRNAVQSVKVLVEDMDQQWRELAFDEETRFVEYFPEGPQVSATERFSRLLDAGERLIRDDDCLLCHDRKKSGVGPAFELIAERYSPSSAKVDELIDYIIDGSQGRWGSRPMTPHPDLERSDAQSMVTWILSLNSDSKRQLSHSSEVDLFTEYTERAHGWLNRKWKAVISLVSEDGSESVELNTAPNVNKLSGVHPSFDVSQARPESFQPKVGGLDIGSEGQIFVSTWSPAGEVFVLEKNENGEVLPRRIAYGLAEPLGLKAVNGDLYVLQKQELTHLEDTDGDGIVDLYTNVSNQWPASTNYHEFSFGLLYRDGYFFASLATAVEPGGYPDQPQLSGRGSVIRIDADSGSVDYIASGLRTPNGLGFGPDGALYVTDNQGSWLPANKIIRVKRGAFYGFRGLTPNAHGEQEEPPLAYIPQDEVGNSPSQPVPIDHGPFKDQLLYGDVTHGGIKRVTIDQVGSVFQGCVYRFSQGLESGINRMVWSPDKRLLVGGIGVRGNWGQAGKLNYGLQWLTYNGRSTFEVLKAQLFEDSIVLSVTEPVDPKAAEDVTHYQVQSWRYEPTQEYGGPKLDNITHRIDSVALSGNGTRIQLSVSGLREGRVVYINGDITNKAGVGAWANEAWCTANRLEPSGPSL